MKRNLLLLAFFMVSLLLVVNSTKKLLSFKTTAQKVEDAQLRLEKLKEENEALKRELEYRKSQEFTEGEIRNKLGLAKEGEAIVILPDNNSSPASRGEQSTVNGEQLTRTSNYIKWWDLFFGG